MRVLVAMSGGVDSSAVAGLLAEAGHEVIGVTLQLYDHGAATGRKGACCAGQDIHDARRVADRLGIPHYVIDAEARFRAAVIADFADSYAAGETPVPCVRCNQTVKFTDLMALADDLGAERLATGHYVRRVDGPDGAGTAPRRRPGARPELVPVRHHARAAGALAVSARRHAGQGGGAGGGGAARACRWRPSRTARTSASCRRAATPRWWRGCGPDALAPGEIVDRRRASGRPARRASPATPWARRSGWARRRRTAAGGGWWWRWTPARRRVVVGPRRRRHAAGAAARGELAGRRRGRCAARSSCAPAMRRTRPRSCRPRTAPRCVLDAPALPAPGQACVFYDGDAGAGRRLHPPARRARCG